MEADRRCRRRCHLLFQLGAPALHVLEALLKARGPQAVSYSVHETIELSRDVRGLALRGLDQMILFTTLGVDLLVEGADKLLDEQTRWW